MTQPKSVVEIGRNLTQFSFIQGLEQGPSSLEVSLNAIISLLSLTDVLCCPKQETHLLGMLVNTRKSAPVKY